MEREFQIHRSDEDYALAEFYRWAIAFLIGVSMGCLGFIVDWGIETLNNFKYNNTFDVVNSQGAGARLSRKSQAKVNAYLGWTMRVFSCIGLVAPFVCGVVMTCATCVPS